MANPEPLLVSDALLNSAEQRCRARLQNDPDNPTLLEQFGDVLRKLGKIEEAAVAYGRLSELRPGDEQAQYRYAVMAGLDPAPLPPPGIQPAPFVFLKNFLPEALHARLVPYTVSIEEQLTPAKVGNDEYQPEQRESLELRENGDINREVGMHVRKVLQTIRERLHIAPFELGRVEVKLRVYLDGHFFRLHFDNPPNSPTSCHRQLSYVYFFHNMPRAYTGGDLLLFDTDLSSLSSPRFTTAAFTKIRPQDNGIVFFPSGSYHSVVPVSCPSKQIADSRFVMNGHVSKVAPPKPEVAAPAPAPEAAAAAVVS